MLFRSQPGEQEVHPSLGRISFLIGKSGVKLHWITDGADQEWTGLSDDNSIASQDFTTPEVPLNVNQWNKVQLAISEGVVEISLNGKALGRRKIKSDNDQKFGFFHYKDRTEARVRNVVLRGDWPKQITNQELNRLAAGHVKGLKRGQRITRNQNIGDGIIGSRAFEVYRIGLRAKPEARYRRMKQWVLPSSYHFTYRLYAAFSPNRPAKKLAKLGSSELVAPALLLVDTAQQLGKLEDLKKAVNIRTFRSPDRIREQTALRILIAIATKDAATAAKEMIAMEGMLKRITKATTTARRWPFILAISRGLKYPATRATANRMVEFAVDNQLAGGARYGPVLERYLRKLKAEQSIESMPSFAKNHYQKQWSLKHWFPVSHSRAKTRGDGYPVAKWLTAKGELRFLAGQDTDLVYYQMPVTGNFEIQADLSTLGWRETDIFAAGLYSAIRSDRKTVELGQFDRKLPGKLLKPPFKSIGFWYKYRVVVKDGQYTAYVDGRRIHTQRLPAQPDPWIAVRTDGRYHGGVRNLRILGNPKVPKEISLSSLPDLGNWDPRYYNESTSGANSHWQKRGELIVGRKHSTLSGSFQQSLLRYHRPLLEDGQVSYEFFYQPGKTHVHPALDRRTFLLDEQGVKLHTMTDERYDRSGMQPNNFQIVAENRRGNGKKKLDLKPNRWNKVALSIKGQTVLIKLNDELVYEHKLTAPNSRLFGLFHYADKTEARVRKVTYRGDWPNRIPPVEEQQLAASVSWDVPENKSLAEHFEVDFAKGYQQSADLKLVYDEHKQFLQQGKEGLVINIPEGRKKGLEVQFRTKFKIRGDFDILAEYDQLKATKVDNVFGGGFDLFVYVEGNKDRVSIERRIVASGQQLKVAHGVLDAKKKYRWYAPRFKEPSTGGRMRFIRQGPTLYYLFAAEKSPRFRLVGMRTIGTKDLETIGVKGGTRAKNASTHVRLKKLSIHAERLVR